MARFQLSPQQVVTINNAIDLLAEFGGHLTSGMVFGDYNFYRRQDDVERQVETLETFIETLEDLHAQLKEAAKLDEERQREIVLLESKLETTISGIRMMHRRHRAGRLLRRMGSSLFGPGH